MLPIFLLAISPWLQSAAPDPARDFDFWIGEWQVQNRHLMPNGVWQDGSQTRDRITPMIDGAAILEQWAGPLGGGFMNGFSLRSYDPAQDLWTIILFWTTDGNANFGKMEGRFRHGRGTFLSPLNPTPGQGNVTRYTFSDGLENTVRWDQANSSDGGITWSTSWIMEFTRTASAASVSEEKIFSTPWNAGTLSPHVEARQLDWLRGHWTGTETEDEASEKREAILDCTLLDKDCLVLTQWATRQAEESDWDKSLQVRGYVANQDRWEVWSVSEQDTVLRQAIGQEGDHGLEFLHTDSNGDVLRETFQRIDSDHLRWSLSRITEGQEPHVVLSRDLVRE